jgi:phosphate transport system substrate-binding protein
MENEQSTRLSSRESVHNPELTQAGGLRRTLNQDFELIMGSTQALPLLLAACFVLSATTPLQAEPKQAATLEIAGSSTVYPLTRAAILAFQQRQGRNAVKLKARSIGTSAGLREFCAGKIPVAAASRPINSKELAQCASTGIGFLELPIAFDAITVVVNPKNNWARQISPEQLNRLWSRSAQGTVKTWKQVNSKWPDQPIKLCGPGTDSGTYDTFNKVINGQESNSRQDYSSSEDDQVLVACVSRDPLALGYFGYDYYKPNQNKLRALAIVGPRGPVLPSLEAVQKSRYLPLSRPLFFYVNEQQLRNVPQLRTFISQTIQAGAKISAQAGAIPLPDSTYRLVTSKLYLNVQGSSFAGNPPVGLTLGQILDRSFDALKQQQFR